MINRYYDYEYIELIRMFDTEDLAPHSFCRITNPYFWKFMSWLLFKQIIFTKAEHLPAIALFIYHTTKTMNFQNIQYRLGNLWCTFIMPINKASLYISNKDIRKQIISRWRLKVGR
jgi:hypothetical protein